MNSVKSSLSEDVFKKCGKQAAPPILPYKEDDLEMLAGEVLHSHTTITGVQPKLSLHLGKGDYPSAPKRFTIVGLWGGYILKPPTPHYLHLPEVEDLSYPIRKSRHLDSPCTGKFPH